MQSEKKYNGNDLIARVAAGDEHAFRELFDHYKDTIYSVALRITKSESNAEELVQDVFLNIWLKKEDLIKITDFASYFFIVARNEAYRALKRALKDKRKIEFNSDMALYAADTEEPLALHEYKDLLQKAIERLPPQQKQVYRLVKEQGLSNDQAAEVLHIEPATVKSHLKRAVKSVRAFCVAALKMIILIVAFLQKP